MAVRCGRHAMVSHGRPEAQQSLRQSLRKACFCKCKVLQTTRRTSEDLWGRRLAHQIWAAGLSEKAQAIEICSRHVEGLTAPNPSE